MDAVIPTPWESGALPLRRSRISGHGYLQYARLGTKLLEIDLVVLVCTGLPIYIVHIAAQQFKRACFPKADGHLLASAWQCVNEAHRNGTVRMGTLADAAEADRICDTMDGKNVQERLQSGVLGMPKNCLGMEAL